MNNEWVDITVVGSAYEEQLEIHTGKHRRRPLKLGRVGPFEEKGVGEWEYMYVPTIENGGIKL